MRKSVKACLIAALAFLTISAESYYVSPEGNDEKDGSSEYPFRTFLKAADEAQPGDVVFIDGGIYRETLKARRPGLRSSPITFQAVPGENVIINACDTAEFWTQHSENVFVTEVDTAITQVFIDGEMASQARFPNNTSSNPFEFASFALELTETEVTSTALTQPDGFWDSGIVWAIVGERWIAQTGDIESSKAGLLSIKNNTWAENTGEGIGYITGTMAALDTAGEWHYENGKLYLQLEAGDEPGNHLIEMKTRGWAIDVSGKANVVLKDLATFGGGVNMNNSDRCTLEGLKMEWLSHFVKPNGASSWIRHEWTDIDFSGIGVGVFGSGNVIKNCEIAWSAGDGITLFGTNNRVENCIVHDCNYNGLDCNPLSLNGKGHVITRNTFFNGGRGLIGFMFTEKATITYNDVYNASLVNRDVGGIYTWGTDSKGTEIAYNWVHDIVSVGGYEIGNGIYVDNFCSDITVHHNVIWNCSGNALNYSRPSKNIYFYNNTAFAARDVDFSYIPDGFADTSSGNRMYNNLFSYQVGDFPALKKKNNLTTDELPLRDSQNYDFRLSEYAADAIDKGVVIPKITDGYKGSAPDIGAYEHGGVFWKAGAGTTDTVPITAVMKKNVGTSQIWLTFSEKNDVMSITFDRPFDGSIKMMDIRGRVVSTLYSGEFRKGRMRFDLKNAPLSRGVYILAVYGDEQVIFSERYVR
ncbi:MAG: right-handed parallel beta-helix repeat-containing protein [Chitinispirillaceae bacterium]